MNDYGWVYKDPICKRLADEWSLTIDELITTFQVMDDNDDEISYIQWMNPHLNKHTIENRLRSAKRRGRYITQEEGE